MSQHAVGKLAGHGVEAGGSIVKGRDQREDGSPRIGGSVHVADVHLIERRLANAEHERAFFL